MKPSCCELCKELNTIEPDDRYKDMDIIYCGATGKSFYRKKVNYKCPYSDKYEGKKPEENNNENVRR